MRSFFLICCLLLTIGAGAQTMPIDSFYAPGARWVEYSYYVWGLGQSRIEGRAYWTGGDSVMHGKTYHLVYSNMLGQSNTAEAIPGPGLVTTYVVDTTDFGLVGGIRVQGSQVFFYRIADSMAFLNIHRIVQDTETLVYDYSLIAGDSVGWQTYNPTWGLYNVVRDTDTINLSGSVFAHRIVFDSGVVSVPTQNYWVEGIGSALGFLGSHCDSGVWGFMSTHMLCYTRGAFSYKFPNFLAASLADNCFDMALLSAIDTKKPEETISMYPNPVEGDVLYFSGDLTDVTHARITDVTGRCVAEVADPFARGASIAVTLPNSGVYFVRLSLVSGGTKTLKLVKQ
jgi:hypothetical protein